MAGLAVVLSSLLLLSCTTSYIEFEGECVLQRWAALGYTIRLRQICDLPKPQTEGLDDRVIRDKEPMNPNPFPDLIGEENPADSMDPDLLEKERLKMRRGE